MIKKTMGDIACIFACLKDKMHIHIHLPLSLKKEFNASAKHHQPSCRACA